MVPNSLKQQKQRKRCSLQQQEVRIVQNLVCPDATHSRTPPRPPPPPSQPNLGCASHGVPLAETTLGPWVLAWNHAMTQAMFVGSSKPKWTCLCASIVPQPKDVASFSKACFMCFSRPLSAQLLDFRRDSLRD